MNALVGLAARGLFALDFQESGDLTHNAPPGLKPRLFESIWFRHDSSRALSKHRPKGTALLILLSRPTLKRGVNQPCAYGALPRVLRAAGALSRLCRGGHQKRRNGGRSVDGLSAGYAQDALVLVREDLDELGLLTGPVLEDPCGARAAGEVAMAREQGAEFFDVFRVDQRFEIDAGLVAAARGEVALIVVDVGDAAAHAGGEVAAGGTEDDDEAVGHVLAAVVADAFNNGGGAGVADGEALAGDAVEISFAAGCAVEDDVADEDAFLRQEAGGLGRIGDDAAAGEAFAEVVVGVAFKLEGDAVGNEGAEALAGGAVEA